MERNKNDSSVLSCRLNSGIVYSRSASVVGIMDDSWLCLFKKSVRCFSCKNRIFGIIMLFFFFLESLLFEYLQDFKTC